MRILIAVLFAGNVSAADTCCVDEDIAAAFLTHANFSRDWPGEFPVALDLEGFEFVGSSRYGQAANLAVAWKTDLDPQSSRELVTEAIAAQGWTSMPSHERADVRNQRGFIPHQIRETQDNQQFCRDRDGTLSVQARESTVGTVLTLTHHNDDSGRDCAGRMAAQTIRQSYSVMGFGVHLPTLTLPESIQAWHGGGVGSGGDEAHSSMKVNTDVSAAEVSYYFEPQMKAQQWTLESDIQGGSVSGHIWRRTADGLDLVCIVTATETRNGLSLRMLVEGL